MDEALLTDPFVRAVYDALRDAYATGGWLAVLGAVLMFAVRVARMVPALECYWSELSKWAQRGAVFGSAAVGALVVAHSTGVALGMAVPGALVAGMTATVLHKGTQAVGAKLRSTGNPKVDAALALAFGDRLQGPPMPDIKKDGQP